MADVTVMKGSVGADTAVVMVPSTSGQQVEAQAVVIVNPNDGSAADPTSTGLGAGENHIGSVGGQTVISTASPTVTASSAYASGNLIGGKLTFAGIGRIAGGSGLIQMGLIQAKTVYSFAADLILFHTDPTNTTFTDKAAVAIDPADFDKVIGKIAFVAGDWTTIGTPSFAQESALAMAYKLANGATSAFGALISRGTPTFATTADIRIVLKALLD